MIHQRIPWRDVLKILIPISLGISLLCGMIVGCADPDGFTGEGVLGEHFTTEPQEITIYPEVDTISSTTVPTGGSNYIHLGHVAGLHSAILMKFTSFPSLKDTFILDSAVVSITPNQVFRDSLVFHEGYLQLSWISDEWSEASVIIDSLPSYGTYPVMETTWTISPADSDTLKLSLPTSVVRSWIDGDTTNQGFLLEMTNESGFVRQYFASEASVTYRPRLQIYYTWYDSGSTGWVEYNSDTTAYANHDANIVWDDIELDDDILMIGNGVSYRSLLRFDINEVLSQFGVSIHSANLTLHLNLDHPLNFHSVPSALRQRLESLSWLDDPQNPDVAAAASQAVLIDSASFSISLASYTLDWVNSPNINYGCLIRSDNQGWDLAREVFYSRAAPDTALWPSLHIVYSWVEE